MIADRDLGQFDVHGFCVDCRTGRGVALVEFTALRELLFRVEAPGDGI